MSSATTTTSAEGHDAHAADNADAVRGLAVAEDNLQVVLEDAELRRSEPQELGFRIPDERGRTGRAFDVEHTKRMHLILARRDLAAFQHLHPTQRADGSWTTDATLEDAGSYRRLADFSIDKQPRTLASGLRVDGPVELRPLTNPEPSAVSDGGYDVRLEAGDAQPGRETELRFTITKDRAPIDVEPYLAAGGHDDSIHSASRYRLFLQFQHEGEIHTVAFTQEVTR